MSDEAASFDPMATRWADSEKVIAEKRREIEKLLGDMQVNVRARTAMWLLSAEYRFVDWVVEKRGVKRSTAEAGYLQGFKAGIEMLMGEMKAIFGEAPEGEPAA